MKKIGVLFTIINLGALEAFAQVAASPTPMSVPVPAGSPAPAQWLVDIMGKFPKLTMLLFIMGGLRLTLKPLFAFLHQFFQGWGLVAWDKKETEIETSKAMNVLYFLLDYFASVKIPVSNDGVVATAAKVDAPK